MFVAALKEGVMRGLQSHLETGVVGVRERGMATGQCLINILHPRPKDQQLHFDLGENPDVEAILELARLAPINAHLITTCYFSLMKMQASGRTTEEAFGNFSSTYSSSSYPQWRQRGREHMWRRNGESDRSW